MFLVFLMSVALSAPGKNTKEFYKDRVQIQSFYKMGELKKTMMLCLKKRHKKSYFLFVNLVKLNLSYRRFDNLTLMPLFNLAIQICRPEKLNNKLRVSTFLFSIWDDR